jgi:DNA-directed RNA polymerase subunit RPC12/RpoP
MHPVDEQPKCPNCNAILEGKPSRKQECPYCHRLILVRDRRLVTEEQAAIMDWLFRLEGYGVTRGDFDRHRDELSIEFGFLE